VRLSLTKGMIAADFLADPPGTGLDMPSQTTVSWSKSFRKTSPDAAALRHVIEAGPATT
jgi:hypothetical protein